VDVVSLHSSRNNAVTTGARLRMTPTVILSDSEGFTP
jgi:hypothetical protein